MKKDLNFMPQQTAGNNRQYSKYCPRDCGKSVVLAVIIMLILNLLWLGGSTTYYLIANNAMEQKISTEVKDAYRQLKWTNAFIDEKVAKIAEIKKDEFDPISYFEKIEKVLPTSFNVGEINVDKSLKVTITGDTSNPETLLTQLQASGTFANIHIDNADNNRIILVGTLERI